MTGLEGRPFYLDFDGTPGCAVLHQPGSGLRDVAVLMIPPFGWEDMCSYRSRRTWAVALAEGGFPTLRFDLPGTGDSGGGPGDLGLVDAWVNAIKIAAAQLRTISGTTQVAAIGCGLGGLLMARAAETAGVIDQVVVWSVPARGRPINRELKAFAQLQVSDGAHDVGLAEGAISVNGYLLSAETLAAINDIDLRAAAQAGRALLLERDGMPVDDDLRSALTGAGADVTVAAGDGYGTLMAPPQDSQPPAAVMATVASWLEAGSSPRQDPPVMNELRVAAVFSTSGGDQWEERLVMIDSPTGSVGGVLNVPSESTADWCVVMLNAGAQRRIGPNRMWVETARRWAARGVPSLRFDLSSIGDSVGINTFPMENHALYQDYYADQIRSVLDGVAGMGLPSRFLLMGLCSGAFWSFQIAQVDRRVEAVILLNPEILIMDPYVETLRTARHVQRFRQADTWRELVHGRLSMAGAVGVTKAVVRAGVAAPGRLLETRRHRMAGGDDMDQGFDRLRDNGVDALLVFSACEPLRREMAQRGRLDLVDRWPNLEVRLLDGTVNTHTLQPPHLQHGVNRIVDAAIENFVSGPRSAARLN